MSKLTQLEMTLDEARETDRLIKRHINTTRYLLLDMRDRKGWKALGYESFVDYGEKELNLGTARIYQLADAAEISLQLGFSKILEKQPTESHLVPLKAVPEEERKVIWEEATRKAEEEHAKLTAKRIEEAVEQWKTANEDTQTKLATEQQRNAEWQAQNKAKSEQIQSLQRDLNAAQNQPKPEPVKVIERIKVIPADYEAIKAKAAQLEAELATNKAEQNRIIQSAIKAKLQGYQGEVDALEAKKNNLERQAKEYQDYLASLTGKVKQMESQSRAFEKSRQALADLASELHDFTPVDPDLTRRALALAEMHNVAVQSLRMVFEPARQTKTLTLIQGDAA
ncbi:MAG: hypothetical protein IPL99_12155 [Candidatus Competibacteraceae bacterium]|nr:hypothetical protein [Candidatus Competibacteraceae bacterium]